MNTMNKNTNLSEFYEKCKENNLKITPQRTIIYQELALTKAHPSVEFVYKKVKEKIPNISFDTVYRTTQKFASVGIIKQIEGFGGEKRYDGDTSEHHHLKCIKCGKVIDFTYPFFDSIETPKHLENDFVIIGKKIILEGICKSCNNK